MAYQIVLVVQHYSSKISVYLNTFPQQHIFPSNNKKRSSAFAEERLLFLLILPHHGNDAA